MEQIQINASNTCIGCGTCAAMSNGTVAMSFDRQRGYQPVRLDGSDEQPVPSAACLSCPFGDDVVSESVISERLYASTEGVENTSELGFFVDCFAGHVTDPSNRARSTSGGLATWLMGQFLDTGDVDAVICVAPTEDSDILFEYSIVTNSADLARTRKARYYPVETSSVIAHVLENEGRYAFIGLPCAVKSVRLAAFQDDRIKDRIVRVIAIFCGHMKTPQYADYLSRTVGVDSLHITNLDFRQKTANPPAQDYEFAAQDTSGRSGSVHMQSIPGGNWGQTLFMQDACNWCDDVVGETADVSLGDAWIPPYQDDPLGTSLVVVRSPDVLSLLQDGVASGQLDLEPISPSDVAESQAGSFRQRRAGLAYRLHLAEKAGRQTPPKRVASDPAPFGPIHRSIHRSRLRLQGASRTYYAAYSADADNSRFLRRMVPLIWYHQLHYRVQRWAALGRRTLSRLRRQVD